MANLGDVSMTSRNSHFLGPMALSSWSMDEVVQEILPHVFETCGSVGMILVNRAGRVLAANSEAEHMFAYASGELKGEPLASLLPEKSRPVHEHFCRSFFASPSTRPMGTGRHLVARRHDGSEFPVEIGLNPVVCRSEPIVLAVIADISERVHKQQHAQDESVDTASRQQQGRDGVLIDSVCSRLRNPVRGIVDNIDALQTQRAGLRTLLAALPKDDAVLAAMQALDTEEPLFQTIARVCREQHEGQ